MRYTVKGIFAGVMTCVCVVMAMLGVEFHKDGMYYFFIEKAIKWLNCQYRCILKLGNYNSFAEYIRVIDDERKPALEYLYQRGLLNP